MLEVRTETAIGGHRCPLVIENSRSRLAEDHHGLDVQHHALAQLRAMSPAAVVWNLRLFVQLRADAVPYKLAYHAESRGLYMLLHCCANVFHCVPDTRLLNTAVKRCFGDFQQLLQFRLQSVAP